jgi:hypothetical protein
MKLGVMQDPRTMSPWNAYLQVLNFPACVGPVRSVINTVSDGSDMGVVDASTSVVPHNIGSSILNNPTEETYQTNANMLFASLTVPESPAVARLPVTTPRSPGKSTDNEGKKKRKISYHESGKQNEDQMDSTGFI